MDSLSQAPDMIGEAPQFLDVLAKASAIAPLERPVLIAGERGTGKELLAARLHFLSSRWEGPFIKVNCAALSEDLLESELFGHEAGAFTGATKRHAGRFERAEGGTLFLDEIASASGRIQEKLLRVIEYGEFERLGGTQTHHADVRILAAANIDLRASAAKGDFRADLLDRLTFEVITAPPLRERVEDVPLLGGYFAGRFTSELSAQGYEALYEGFTPEALAILKGYSFPGNVRELKNCVERSVFRWIAAEKTGPVDTIILDPFDEGAPPLPKNLAQSAHEAAPQSPGAPIVQNHAPADLRAFLNGEEEKWTRHALQIHGWNQKRAAKALNLSYDQLRGLIRKHKLKPSAE